MTALKDISRHISRCLAAAFVAGGISACGVAPMMAQQTTAAALAPFTTAAQATNATLQTLGRGMSALSAQTAQTTRQIQITNANLARYQTQARPVSYQAPRSMTTAGTARQEANATSTSREPIKPTLDILPQDVLKRLTTDQEGLQRAAQTEAMTATVGEVIFWHADGREGSAMTESENVMGAFTCRTFVQTIALEDYFDKASLTACRNDSGAWTQLD